MQKFKIICPECSTVVVTSTPESILWDLCPGCRRHVWDTYDSLMAEVFSPGPAASLNRSARAEN